MKQLLSILLAVVFISQSFTGVGVVVYYHVNKAYIAQQLCENRNKPEMHCNGHCYLSKQLKSLEEKEQKHVNNIVKEKEEVTGEKALAKEGPFFTEDIVTLFHPSCAVHSQYCYLSPVKPPAA